MPTCGSPQGRELGLVDDERWNFFTTKRDAIDAEVQRLDRAVLHPQQLSEAQAIELLGTTLAREAHVFDLLRRPEVTYAALASIEQVGPAAWMNAAGADERLTEQVQLQVEVQAKYTGYIDRQQDEVERQKRHEETRLPESIDYAQVRGLSIEVRQRLQEARPETIGRAARVPGVTPAAISLLLVHLKRRPGVPSQRTG